MAKITLQQMEFHAFHGCLEHEKNLGNTFWVNVSFEMNTTTAGETDELADTLNYQLIYDIVKSEMAIPSQLIEHVAQRIQDKIFSEFTVIESLTVQLIKFNPPLGGKVNNVSIELSKQRKK